MIWNGLNVNGYHTNGKGNDDYGMQACSLTDIGAFSTVKKTDGQTWQGFLEELATHVGYNGEMQGNFLFCISSTQLDKFKTPTDCLLHFLLAHENTQIIHHYYNNAHGPCCLFICIHHMFPKQVKRKVKNNVKEYMARHVYDVDMHQYSVKEKGIFK